LKTENKIWLEYLINTQNPEASTFRCRLCNSFLRHDNKQYKNLPLLSTNLGFFTPNYKTMYKRLSQHSESDLHKKSIWKLKEDYLDNLQQCQKSNLERKVVQLPDLVITSKMIRTVYAEIKMNIPFYSHNDLVTLQKLNGVDMGLHHTDFNAAMVEVYRKVYG